VDSELINRKRNLKSLKSDVLILSILLPAFAVSLFLLWAYSSLLNFFPWGNGNAYVIWEPLVLYFIVPVLIFVGCLTSLLSKQKAHRIPGLHLLFIGLSFTLPGAIGFDLETDLRGRWGGVLVSIIATVLIVTDISKAIKRIKTLASTP
jgi:hypothetical protein